MHHTRDTAVPDYCRQIESYLCQKNDGHLIRVVGPSFDMVARWATDGVPLKVAFGGIDRYFDRYYRNGRRRRPVRIDFCEPDVLDVFEEWRRATGVTSAARVNLDTRARRHGPSVPEHLERVLLRLTNARVTGVLGSEMDALIDQISAELDRARASAGGVRGAARKELLDRLAAADAALLELARVSLDRTALDDIRKQADADLAGYDNGIPIGADIRERAIDAIVRDRLGLPTIAFF